MCYWYTFLVRPIASLVFQPLLWTLPPQPCRLQEQTVSSLKSAPPSPPHPLPPHTPVDKDVDVNVARWIEERDILLQTGVYTSSDPTIQRLDQRIREKLAERTQ